MKTKPCHLEVINVESRKNSNPRFIHYLISLFCFFHCVRSIDLENLFVACVGVPTLYATERLRRVRVCVLCVCVLNNILFPRDALTFIDPVYSFLISSLLCFVLDDLTECEKIALNCRILEASSFLP